MIRLHEGEVYVFFRVVHAARDVVEVEINCTKVADTDPIISLRNNWSCYQHRAELSSSKDTTLSRR